jgi:hypothetical protein
VLSVKKQPLRQCNIGLKVYTDQSQFEQATLFEKASKKMEKEGDRRSWVHVMRKRATDNEWTTNGGRLHHGIFDP